MEYLASIASDFMIDDLNSLKAYAHGAAEKLPALKDEILLESPGISPDDDEQIRAALPDLPESYLTCIRSLDVKGKFIGYFRLWPRMEKLSLAKSIIQTNTSEKNPFLEFLRRKNLYEVAAWEAEPICVATGQSAYKEGSIVKISIGQPELEISLLADNFESFLFIAGNLDAARDEHSRTGNRALADAKIEQCLKHFELSIEEVRHWKKISDVVIST